MYRSLAIYGTIKLLLISSSLICNNSLLPFLISVWAIVILPFIKASLLAQHDKEFACNVGNAGSIPGSGRSPGGGNGYPFEYSWLENSMDRGAWQVTVHGVSHIPDTENLCIHPFFHQSGWKSISFADLLKEPAFCSTDFLLYWFLLFYIYMRVYMYMYVYILVSIGSLLLN